jgi:predicted Zn-dependent protease with MMP-like domain
VALSPLQRKAFDALLDEVLASLPPKWKLVLDDVRLVIDDRPTKAVLDSLGMPADQALELCGLHTGVPRTERGLEEAFDGESLGFASEIELYREGILLEAGGGDEPASLPSDRESVREQIRITLLHELGHELGLDEDDLERLGYD